MTISRAKQLHCPFSKTATFTLEHISKNTCLADQCMAWETTKTTKIIDSIRVTDESQAPKDYTFRRYVSTSEYDYEYEFVKREPLEDYEGYCTLRKG